MNCGLFIVLEGIDGSGTTTQVERVAKQLRKLGHDVVATREPTQGPVGQLLRAALEKRLTRAGSATTLDTSTLALLFAADRMDHCRAEIEPALRAGKVVISDRYLLSTLVYQSATAAHGEEILSWLVELNRPAIRPDLTLVLDLDASEAARRRSSRGGEPELFEVDELQQRLAAGYARAAELLPEDDVVIVEGGAEMAQVTDRLLREIIRCGSDRGVVDALGRPVS